VYEPANSCWLPPPANCPPKLHEPVTEVTLSEVPEGTVQPVKAVKAVGVSSAPPVPPVLMLEEKEAVAATPVVEPAGNPVMSTSKPKFVTLNAAGAVFVARPMFEPEAVNVPENVPSLTTTAGVTENVVEYVLPRLSVTDIVCDPAGAAGTVKLNAKDPAPVVYGGFGTIVVIAEPANFDEMDCTGA